MTAVTFKVEQGVAMYLNAQPSSTSEGQAVQAHDVRVTAFMWGKMLKAGFDSDNAHLMMCKADSDMSRMTHTVIQLSMHTHTNAHPLTRSHTHT